MSTAPTSAVDRHGVAPPTALRTAGRRALLVLFASACLAFAIAPALTPVDDRFTGAMSLAIRSVALAAAFSLGWMMARHGRATSRGSSDHDPNGTDRERALLLATAPISVSVLDLPNGRRDAAASYTLITRADAPDGPAVIGVTDVDAQIHPDDIEMVRARWTTFFDTRGTDGEEATFRLRTPAGLRWFTTRARVLSTSADGSIERVLVIGLDVTGEREAEARADMILEANPNIVLVWDDDTMIAEFANPAFTRVTGYTVDDLNDIDRSAVSTLVHPDDRANEAAAIERAIETGEPTALLHRIRDRDGVWLWFETWYRSLPDIDGRQPRRILINSTDVTARVELQGLHDTIVNESPIAFMVYAPTIDRYDWVNPAFTAVTGFTVDDLRARADRGTPEPVITHPDDFAAEAAAIDRTLETRSPTTLRHRFLCADGAVRTFDSRIVRLEDDPTPARAPRVLIGSLDVTDRVETEQFNETILRSSPALTVVVDAATGTTTFASASFTAATGYTADDLNAMAPAEIERLTPETERVLVDAAIAATLETGELRALERPYRHADGVVRWYDSRFLRLQRGAGTEVLITATDCTERRLATAALENERARLEHANRDLEGFVYIASHDLQEPLRTIAAFASLLRSELPPDLSEEVGEYLQFIDDGTARMRSLITGLLELSRIGREQDVAKVDTALVLDEIEADLADLIEREHATIERGDLPAIVADAPTIHLLLRNLVTNALRFRHADREPRVSVGVTTTSESWRFEVTDNGIGIAPHHTDRVFDVFQRLNPRSAYEGTGIGLAHCLKAVHSHGGAIGVESELGVGSTFWFTIPAPDRSRR